MGKRRLIDLYKRLMVRKAFYRLHRRLFNVSLWGLGVLNSENYEWSGESSFLARLPKYLGQPGPFVILDIGAKLGDYAARATARHPGTTVFAFEPHPQSYARLARRAAEVGFAAVNAAVSEADGTATLYSRPGEDSEHASLYREVIEALHRDRGVPFEVRTVRLDTFVQEAQIEHVHLVKIDAEGSERRVLEGARDLLAAGRIGSVQFEFNEMNVISRTFLRDFAALLPGYQLYRLLPDGLAPLADEPVFLQEIFAFQNIVALRGR